jgi:hypothetical protein
MKIKAARRFVTLVLGLSAAAMVTSITGCASGPLSSNLNGSPSDDKPTGNGDNHTPIVYTSPSVTPDATDLPDGITHP